MAKPTCGDCNCFSKTEYNEKQDKWRGICLCHGYHLYENEEICPDFER